MLVRLFNIPFILAVVILTRSLFLVLENCPDSFAGLIDSILT